MTQNCIDKVDRMNAENGGDNEFAGLSAEQLLYAAIRGTDFNDVYHVLTSTNWLRWLPKKEW